MQELHLVGITTDRQHLIFSVRRSAKSGSYLVAVDDDLRAVVDDLAEERAEREAVAEAEAASAPARPDAQLSVREVQARLRAGATAADVADEAGVDEEWVERFAPPIRAELASIVALARSLPLVRSRGGASAVPLDVAVRQAMAERGVRFGDGGYEGAWSARLAGATWAIDFSYRHRSQDRTVTWMLDPSTPQLTTSDRSASQIGFVAADAGPRPAPTRSRRPRPAPTPSRPNDGADTASPSGPRSTRGDGRPDTAPSTRDVAEARQVAEHLLENPSTLRPRPESGPEPAPPVTSPEPSTERHSVEDDASAGHPADASTDVEIAPPPFVGGADEAVASDEQDGAEPVPGDEVVEPSDAPVDDEDPTPEVAVDHTTDVRPAPCAGTPVASEIPDRTGDEEAVAADDAEPSPRQHGATARFRRGAAVRAGDAEPEPPSEPPSEGSEGLLVVRARPADRHLAPADEDRRERPPAPDPAEPAASNGRPRRRRTRQLRAR